MKWAYISSKCFYPRVRVCSFNSVEQRARLTRLIKDLGVQSSACFNLPGGAQGPRKIGNNLSKECYAILFGNTVTKSKLIDKASQFGSFNKSEKMCAMPMQARPQGITFDEYGRPFIILKEQERQRRLTGLDAQKVNCVNCC